MKRFLSMLIVVAAALASDNSPLEKKVGKYVVSLRLPPDGLAAGEEMQIEFRIADATQVDPVMGPLPIVRSKIATEIDMPDMPSMPRMIETAHPEGVPGDYGIHPSFPHGGAYRLKMHVVPPAGDEADVEFLLNVKDARAVKRRKAPSRFRLDLTADPKTPKAGEAASLRFQVRERENPAVYNNFEVVHEKLMHLIIVSKDLAYFRHEHPEITSDGSFTLRHSFPQPGEYHLFADYAPRGAGTQVTLAKLKVGGKGGNDSGRSPTRLSLKANAGSVSLEMAPPDYPVETNRTTRVPVFLRHASNGSPVIDLENYLGAKAHLIMIHEDAITFVHSHPDERGIKPDIDGTVPFLLRLPKPGLYRAWLQFIRAGRLETAQFEMRAGRQ